jgi:lipopolysaccharide biosynthesis glycosyltransferase
MFCYCSVCDDNYVPHFAAMLASLADRGPHAPFYLISDGISAENLERLDGFAVTLGVDLTVIDGADSALAGLKTNLHFTRAVWLKVFAPRLLPETFDRALILDCDMTVIADLSELVEMGPGDAVIRAVPDSSVNGPAARKRLGMADHAQYINTGVAACDLRKWRAGGYSEKVIEFALSNPEKLHFVDQCAINAVLWDRTGLLDRKWNYLVALDKVPHPDPGILHFAGHAKPWSSKFVPGSEFYFHYSDMTPWADPDPAGYAKNRFDRYSRGAKRMRRALLKNLGAKEYANKLESMRGTDKRIRELSALYRNRTQRRRSAS